MPLMVYRRLPPDVRALPLAPHEPPVMVPAVPVLPFEKDDVYRPPDDVTPNPPLAEEPPPPTPPKLPPPCAR